MVEDIMLLGQNNKIMVMLRLWETGYTRWKRSLRGSGAERGIGRSR
jgi:hypothetical protein